MKTVDEALCLILDAITPLESETVGLHELVGRALAADLSTERALPQWHNSAMDGYAVRTTDISSVPTHLPVVEHIPAGDGSPRQLAGGTAHRIFTGAPLPAGADAVVLQEDTKSTGGSVEIHEKPIEGQHIRRAGSDVEMGETILKKGRTLTAGDVSFAASQGSNHLDVIRKARVRIMSTGNELVQPGSGVVGPGQIIDGNSVALEGAVRSLGALPERYPSLKDDFQSTLDALDTAAHGADVLITTGGVSVGDHDHVREAIRELSGDQFGFWKVAIKPGKPIVFGQIGSCFVFGLPGNPVSALVTFDIFVRPSLLKLMGHRRIMPRPVKAILNAPLQPGRRRREYVRGSVRFTQGCVSVTPWRTQSSGALSSIAAQDALIIVEPGCTAREVGDSAFIVFLGETQSTALLDFEEYADHVF